MNDFRLALRQLLKSRAFTVTAILVLALGIGANTAIFSVVEAVLWRPLPFPHAERLVRILESHDETGLRSASTNLTDRTVARFRDYGRDIFEDVAGATGAGVVVGLNNDSPLQTVPAAEVTANFFSTLGLAPALGRAFNAEEAGGAGGHVVVVSDDFWRTSLDGRADVLGRTIQIDGARRTIIGVMPKAFRHPYRARLWLPLTLRPDDPATLNNHYLYGVGRLRPGVTPPQAEAAVKRMCAAINRDDPNPLNARAAYLPGLRESFVMDLRPKLSVIVAAAVCALLIAAANFAGLLLARVIESEGEFALRAALGASRWRLVRQQLVQALVLAALGTALGLLIVSWATPLLMAMSPEGADATGSAMREFDFAPRLSLPVFGFAAGVMIVVGFGFGAIPAMRAARADLRGTMHITFVLRTAKTASASVNETTVRMALARANAHLAAYNFASLEQTAERSHTTDRFLFILVLAFAALGLILSAIGLYGLLDLQVAHRQREFGIRSALGATTGQLIELVARQGARLLFVGFALAALVSYGLVKMLHARWAGLPSPDILAWLGSAFVLAAAAALACWLPARRAGRADPVIALRNE